MIDLEFLESLIRAIDESSIDTVEIERGGTRVRVSKSPPTIVAEPPLAQQAPGAAEGAGSVVGSEAAGVAGAAAMEGAAAGGAAGGEGGAAGAPAGNGGSEGRLEVTSPMVGTFYRSPAPDAPPYVEVGDRVALGDTLCIIEAMKLMNELESEVAGTVAEICVENADPVEYGQPLFRIEPT